MADGGFLLEMCSGRAAWQIQPATPITIGMEEVAERIVADGWSCTLRNRLCYTFAGDVDLTLFPSGKVLVKSADRGVAEGIAELLLNRWLV